MIATIGNSQLPNKELVKDIFTVTRMPDGALTITGEQEVEEVNFQLPRLSRIIELTNARVYYAKKLRATGDWHNEYWHNVARYMELTTEIETQQAYAMVGA